MQHIYFPGYSPRRRSTTHNLENKRGLIVKQFFEEEMTYGWRSFREEYQIWNVVISLEGPKYSFFNQSLAGSQ